MAMADKWGLGTFFLQWINLLYSNQNTVICRDGFISPKISYLSRCRKMDAYTPLCYLIWLLKSLQLLLEPLRVFMEYIRIRCSIRLRCLYADDFFFLQKLKNLGDTVLLTNIWV